MAFLRLIPLLIIILVAGCNESEPKPNRSEMIAGDDAFGKAWRITKIEVSLGELVVNSCIADNIIRYYPDGRYEVSEGFNKCDPNDPPALTGEWMLSQNETVLTVNMTDSVVVWDIDFLSDENQEITASFIEGDRTYTLSSSN